MHPRHSYTEYSGKSYIDTYGRKIPQMNNTVRPVQSPNTIVRSIDNSKTVNYVPLNGLWPGY